MKASITFRIDSIGKKWIHATAINEKLFKAKILIDENLKDKKENQWIFNFPAEIKITKSGSFESYEIKRDEEALIDTTKLFIFCMKEQHANQKYNKIIGHVSKELEDELYIFNFEKGEYSFKYVKEGKITAISKQEIEDILKTKNINYQVINEF